MRKILTLITICFLLSSLLSAFAQNNIWTWHYLSEPGLDFTSRGDAGTVIVNNQLYILGGKNNCGPKDFISYNLISGQGKRLAPLGFGCANGIEYGCLFSVGGKIYSFSGNGFGIYDTSSNSWQTGNYPLTINLKPDCGFVINDTIFLVSQYGNYFYSYNTVTNTFHQRANTICSANRESAIAFSINGKGYFGAGVSGYNWYSDFYQYDPLLDTWTIKASLPINLYKGVGASDNNKGYAGLGITLSGTNNFLVPNWYEYNPITNLWSVKQSAYYVSQDHSACYYNGKVYLFGGRFGNSGAPYRDDIRAYNIASNTWSTINDDPGTNRTESSGFYSNGKIYIAGGQDEESLNDMREYNIANNTWTQKSNSYSYFAQRASCDINGIGYFIGGFNKNLSGTTGNPYPMYFDSLIKYDPATDTWSNISQYPGGKRGNMTMVSYNGNIYAGMGTNINGLSFNTDFRKYDLTTNTWTSLANIPMTNVNYDGRFKSYFVIADTLYLYTGATAQTYHLFKYSFLSNSWSVDAVPSFLQSTSMYYTNEGCALNGKGYVVILTGTQEELAEYDPASGSWKIVSSLPSISASSTFVSVPNDGIYFGFGVDEGDMGALGISRSNHWKKLYLGLPKVSNQIGIYSSVTSNGINATNNCGNGILELGTTGSMTDTNGNLFSTLFANAGTQYTTCITHYSKDTLLPYVTACTGFGNAYNSTTENGMFLNKSFVTSYSFYLSGGNTLRLYYTSSELNKFLAAFNSKYNLNYTIDSMKLISIDYPSVVPDDNPLNNGVAPVKTFKINWQNYGTDKYFDVVTSPTVSLGNGEYYIALSARAYRKVTTTVCDSLVFKNHTYYTSGNYTLNVPNAIGCDSTFDVNLTIINSTHQNITQTSCQSFTLNGTTYTSSGNYIQHLTNFHGCDSTINLSLIINPHSSYTINQSICSGDSVLFNNLYLKTSGIYKDTLTNYLSCDSIITLNLSVKKTSLTTIAADICQGDSYLLGSNSYTTAGVYNVSFTNYVGCDSIVNLTLNVLPVSSKSIFANICQGGSYSVGTTTFNSAGSHIVHLINYRGCDSVITLNLLVNPVTKKNITHSMCSGDNYFFHNQFLNSAGLFYDTLINHYGCDSIITLNLIVHLPSSGLINKSICMGDNYLFNGHLLTTAGVFLDTLVNRFGCDSFVTLNLTINSLPNTPTITVNGCELFCDSTASKYQWYFANNLISGANQQSYTVGKSGAYSVQITNLFNCSSKSANVQAKCNIGIEDLVASTFTAFPNPTSGLVEINLGSTIKSGVVSIINEFGQLVGEIKISNQSHCSFDLTNFSNGVYLIQMNSENKIRSVSIIKTN